MLLKVLSAVKSSKEGNVTIGVWNRATTWGKHVQVGSRDPADRTP